MKSLKPGFLVSESFFPILSDENRLIDSVKKTISNSFYGRIEISAMKTDYGKKGLRELAKIIPVTQWITNDLNEGGYCASTIDSELRKKTISEISRLIEVAAESGADRVAIISGPDPGESNRMEAAKGLTEVLIKSAEIADKNNITIMLEPLDRGAHKNNFIGPTNEAIEIMKAVHREYRNVLISWDSAHVALNNEDLCESITDAFAYIGQIHLSNAILDSNSKEYGDWHMPMGEPGFLTVSFARKIAARAIDLLKEDETMGITIESRSLSEDDIFINEEFNRKFLQEVLEGI